MCVSVQCGYLSCRIFECACVVTCEWGYYIVFISFHTKNCCYRLSWHASAIVCRYILVDMVSLPLRKWKYFVIIVNARKISNYRIVAFVNRFGIFTLSLSFTITSSVHSLVGETRCLFAVSLLFSFFNLHFALLYCLCDASLARGLPFASRTSMCEPRQRDYVTFLHTRFFFGVCVSSPSHSHRSCHFFFFCFYLLLWTRWSDVSRLRAAYAHKLCNKIVLCIFFSLSLFLRRVQVLSVEMNNNNNNT